jgi:hypothetical protein
MIVPGQAVPPSPFAVAVEQLIALGYHPIPLMPRDKIPGMYSRGRWTAAPEWPRLRDRQLTTFEQRVWSKWPDANVGLVCGTPAGQFRLGAIDIDTDDPVQLEMLLSSCPSSPMSKRGAKGRTLFYRVPPELKTRRYGIAKRVIAELLTGNAPRQTVVPPSIHPYGPTYAWIGEPVHVDHLPVFDADALERLEDTLRHIGWDGDTIDDDRRERSRQVPRHDGDPTIWRELNDLALTRLDAWVPSLNLYNCRPARGGYEAVAVWRPSSTGKPPAERSRNLKIHPDGIRDFGADATYSPLDLVTTALGFIFDDAFAWLGTRLGFIAGEPVEITTPRQTIEVEDGTVADAETGEILVAPPAPARSRQGGFPAELTRVPGLVGEITDWITATARRPSRAMALAAAISIVGTALGRNVGGPTNSGTHSYVLTLAPTGAGKEHAIQQIRRILIAAGLEQFLGSEAPTTSMAIISLLNRKPCSICTIDEFGGYLRRVNGRKASGFERESSKVYRTLWGINFGMYLTPDWAQRASTKIYAPAISIFGTSTPAEFFASLDGDDVINGFLNRFLMFSVDERPGEVEPALYAQAVPASISDRLMELAGGQMHVMTISTNNEIVPNTVPWGTPAAEAVYRTLATEIQIAGDREPECEAFYSRTAEMAVRLATVRACGRNTLKPRVEVDDMEWGRDVAWHSANQQRRLTKLYIADTEIQGEANRILRILTDHGGPMKKRDLLQRLRHRMRKRDLDDLIKALEESGSIAVQMIVPQGGGTPSAIISIIG